MSERGIVICNPVRTTIGTFGGSLKDTPAPDLGAFASRRSGYSGSHSITM
jgi:acetyl-CoA C-acetyltransferase